MDTILELLNAILQSEAFFRLLMFVVVLIAGWVAKSYSDWKKKSGNKEEVETIEKAVKWGVEFVEQVFKEEDNVVKLEKAKETARDFLDSRGIRIGGRQLSEIAEAMVFEIKNKDKEKEPIEVDLVDKNEEAVDTQGKLS